MCNDEYLQARELVNLSSCDKWLLNRIQTYDFDGTWVSIICGLYQSLYFYRTEIVEEHLLSCRLSNHLVLPKAKVMVLLLRWQHLQKFQRLVTERLLESYPANMKIQIIEMLSNEVFLIESLITSIHHTATQMDIWARDQTLYSRKLYIELVELIKSEEMKTKEAIELQPERRIPLIKLFLVRAFILYFEIMFVAICDVRKIYPITKISWCHGTGQYFSHDGNK
jgi:hypothetical protein